MTGLLRGHARALLALALLVAPPGLADDSADTPSGLTITAVGHIVLGSDWPEESPWVPDDAGRGLIDDVAELLRGADLAVANLGVPLTSHPTPRVSRAPEHDFIMRTPPELGPRLRDLGLDVLLAANNHALDFGREGYAESLAHLAALGIDSVGQRGQVVIRTVRGLRIAVVGFTQPYIPEFQSHIRVRDAGDLIEEAREAADVVIALVHGGGEGEGALHVPHGGEYVGREYRGTMMRLSRHLIDRGASAVIGFGAHHPRAMELHKGRLIAYGLGNFLTYGNFSLRSPNHLSLALELTFSDDGHFEEARVIPVRLRHPGIPFIDERAWTLPFLRRISRENFPDSAPVIDADGRIRPR